MDIPAVDSGSLSIDAQVGAIQERLALLAAHRAMKIENDMGQQIITLLDPSTGTRFDKRA